MAIYKIKQDGEEINRIVANDEEWVADYCADNGYTYELEPDPPEPPPPEPTYTADDLFSALLGG